MDNSFQMIENLKDFLDENVDKFNNTEFIENDPIKIPHFYTSKADIEIIGFIIATIAWGNRKSILKNGDRLIQIMGDSPLDFVLNCSQKDLEDLSFIH